MDEMRVADIVKGQPDLAGTTVDIIYKKQTGEYAIYGTTERVMIHFADDPEKRRRQGEALAPLSPVRGEINALIDGWREGHGLNGDRKIRRARAFDRRTADALVVALDGNVEIARDLLTGVKADILDERTSIGRVEYLFASAGAAVLVALLAMLLLGMPSGSIGTFVKNNSTHLAVQLGCLGAFFSTAIGIRNRQVRTDLQRRDNIVDAGLRILIGAISAVILFSILKSGIIGFTLGSKPINLVPVDENDTTLVHTAIVVAFLAGFSERLVGDLLTSRLLLAFTKDGETPAPPVAGGPASAEARASATALAATAAETAAVPPEEAADDGGEDAHEQHEDGCLCDAEKAAIDMTDDRELPPATGGVQKFDA